MKCIMKFMSYQPFEIGYEYGTSLLELEYWTAKIHHNSVTGWVFECAQLTDISKYRGIVDRTDIQPKRMPFWIMNDARKY